MRNGVLNMTIDISPTWSFCKALLKTTAFLNEKRDQTGTVFKKRGLIDGQQFLCSACALN